jgi:HEPN domain-containing protein
VFGGRQLWSGSDEEEHRVVVLSAANLKAIARARLADAEALLKAGRLDGSAYVCGYVVEMALKARICKTLKWPGFPATRSEFEGLQSLKTHDLDVLLHLSGREQYTKVRLFPEWTMVSQWNPEARYQAVGTVTAVTAEGMIAAAQKILSRL